MTKWQDESRAPPGVERIDAVPGGCPVCGGYLVDSIEWQGGGTEGVLILACSGCDWIGTADIAIAND